MPNENEQGGALYFFVLAVLYISATYICASRNLGVGALFGAVGIVIMGACWAVIAWRRTL